MRCVLIACVVACSSTAAPLRESPRPATTSPGPLAQSHERIDNQLGCNDCHVDGTTALSAEKCLACHAAIDERITVNQGLHASALVRGSTCEECHRDHRGRRYDMLGWNALPGGERGFDHKYTGYALRGRHATASCAGCHSTPRTFLGAKRACVACHAKDQPHGTDLGCERCHTAAGWAPLKSELAFAHPARLPLGGAHAGVACTRCHTTRTFAIGDGSCSQCHASPHAPPDPFARFARGIAGGIAGGIDCRTCHSGTFTDFHTVAFDHSEYTSVSLGSAHKKLACRTCHDGKSTTICEQCHAGLQPAGRSVSPHGNRFGGSCELCHQPSKWGPMRFDHRVTGFSLRAKHAQVRCRECHRGANPMTFENLANQRTCLGCHAHRDVHDRKYTNTQCVQCHFGF